jgi:phosphate transport system substrate-binding protein
MGFSGPIKFFVEVQTYNDMKKSILGVLALALVIISCGRPEKEIDTAVSGSIKISADESLRPIVEAELNTFEGIYARAHIQCSYLPETDAIDALMKDSVRLAVVTRRFTEEEKKYFKEIKITPTEFDVAYSGIAVILNRAQKDTIFTLDEIQSLLQGKITSWDQLGGKSKDGIEIVFDNPNSGLIRHLKDSVASFEKLPSNVYAAENNSAVVDYVAKTPNSIGFIGLEWISDRDDSLSNSFLGKIKVAAISIAKDSASYQPYQAYIALKKYPLTRRITILSREARVGLGRGFLNFFASERGQRIVLKSGLVPKTMPLRIVNVHPE